MSLVVDASVVFSWQFPDEQNPVADFAMTEVVELGAVVPIHWRAEIANGFALAVRRNRMPADYRDGALMRLDDLPILVDEESAVRLWTDTQVLCDRHELTAYDAAYLELALRRGLALATLDKALARAARNEGIRLIGEDL